MEKNPYEIIRTNYPSYSKVFRVIADYILNHSDEVLKTNIHKLGRDLDIAESSIVRFCKALGYSGFSELKIMLAKYGRQSSKIIFENLRTALRRRLLEMFFRLALKPFKLQQNNLILVLLKKPRIY